MVVVALVTEYDVDHTKCLLYMYALCADHLFDDCPLFFKFLAMPLEDEYHTGIKHKARSGENAFLERVCNVFLNSEHEFADDILPAITNHSCPIISVSMKSTNTTGGDRDPL